jgi:BASS family bile acid:Na+ symporter
MQKITSKTTTKPVTGFARFFSALGLLAFAIALLLWYYRKDLAAGGVLAAAFGLLALAANFSPKFKTIAFTLWILAFGVCAFWYPEFFISWGDFELKRTIRPLVQLILFGMGMTLTFDDFARVFRMPKAVFIGIALQYTIMPLMGYSFARIFGLEPEVAVGLILIGSCPGGVSSNVITYIAGANVALSVTMTACSTLMAPLMTPLAMKLLAGKYIEINIG